MLYELTIASRLDIFAAPANLLVIMLNSFQRAIHLQNQLNHFFLDVQSRLEDAAFCRVRGRSVLHFFTSRQFTIETNGYVVDFNKKKKKRVSRRQRRRWNFGKSNCDSIQFGAGSDRVELSVSQRNFFSPYSAGTNRGSIPDAALCAVPWRSPPKVAIRYFPFNISQRQREWIDRIRSLSLS